MFDKLLEEAVRKKDKMKSKIRNLEKEIDYETVKQQWNNIEIKEGKKCKISACDGSSNSQKFIGFMLYTVDAEVLIFDGKIKKIKSCDVDIFSPYKHTEDRIRFYMQMLEMKTMINALKNDNIDIALMDGSVLGDIIRPFPFYMNPSSDTKDKIRKKYTSKIEGFESEKIEIYSKKFFKNVKNEFPSEFITAQSFLEYLEHLITLKELLKYGKKIIAISKTSTATDYFNLNLPDMAIFEKANKSQGFSKPKYITISEKLKRGFPILDEFFRNLEFSLFYVRLEDKKNVFKFEIPQKISEREVLEILQNIKTISTDGYPYLLRKVHRDVEIKNSQIKSIKRMFNIIEKTGREVL